MGRTWPSKGTREARPQAISKAEGSYLISTLDCKNAFLAACFFNGGEVWLISKASKDGCHWSNGLGYE
jgi:hypothetical protein